MNDTPKKPILCIYHANCDDGFAAAWAVREHLGENNIEFFPAIYGQDPPDVENRNVVMVDFSYKRPTIERMREKAATLLILDHHKTAAEDLTGYPPAGVSHHEWSELVRHTPGRVMGVLFDMERSGAGIAWDFFSNRAHTGKRRPEFIDYIEDRDLWRKSLSGGDKFTIALRSYAQNFDVWDRLVSDGPDWLIIQGSHIWRYYEKICADIAREAYRADLGAHSCWIVNAPYFAASEVAGALSERTGSFGASYFRRADGRWQYSLRSRTSFDVSELARQFGGGGHAQAAGFETPEPVHQRRAD